MPALGRYVNLCLVYIASSRAARSYTVRFSLSEREGLGGERILIGYIIVGLPPPSSWEPRQDKAG